MTRESGERSGRDGMCAQGTHTAQKLGCEGADTFLIDCGVPQHFERKLRLSPEHPQRHFKALLPLVCDRQLRPRLAGHLVPE